MNRTRALAAGAAGALFVVAATSFASPWWTLNNLQTAVAHHDANAVSAQVDFPALRDSVKNQIAATMKSGGDNPLAAAGASVAMALFSPVVDLIASPRGVELMLEHGRITLPKQAPHASDANVTPERPRFSVRYRSWDRFTVATRDGGNFIFRRAGLWSWKLAGIERGAAP